MVLRKTLPLFLTGTMGVGLLGFGLTGLSSVDPQLRSAAATLERERQTAPLMQNVVDCTPDVAPVDAPKPEV